MGFPGGSDGNESGRNAIALGLIPGLGRSPGEGNGNPLQYSSLENPMDRGAWRATVHGVAKIQTRLSDFHFISLHLVSGFPRGANGKEPTCQYRRHKKYEFDPRVRKLPWRRAWQPTPVSLPGESHGQRSLVGYSP